MKVLVLFTCFNRKEKTENCIKKLVSGNPNIDFEFVVVDDGSTDGTSNMLEQLKCDYKLNVLRGNNLYYSGGMRLGMEYIKESDFSADYFLMVNDDVEFFNNCVSVLINQSTEQNEAVVVGTLQDKTGNLSYGAIKYLKGIKYKTMTIEDWQEKADTFNANCVLIPWRIFEITPSIDKHYIHSLGDFDYGLSITNNGFSVYPSRKFIGLCVKNSVKGTWLDTRLSIKERVKKKESPKGAPTKQWFYFLRKHFGIILAVKHMTIPFFKIFLSK